MLCINIKLSKWQQLLLVRNLSFSFFFSRLQNTFGSLYAIWMSENVTLANNIETYFYWAQQLSIKFENKKCSCTYLKNWNLIKIEIGQNNWNIHWSILQLNFLRKIKYVTKTCVSLCSHFKIISTYEIEFQPSMRLYVDLNKLSLSLLYII